MTKDETFPIVTVCGSMRFFKYMIIAASELTREGYIVLMPFSVFANEEQSSELKQMVDGMHFAKIDMSNEIRVISDLSSYVGDSTKAEIEYAESKDKMVLYQEFYEIGGKYASSISTNIPFWKGRPAGMGE